MGRTPKKGNRMLEATLEAFDKLGVEKTISVLENAINIQATSSSEDIDFILNSVCKEFKVSRDEIIFGKSHKRSPAIACASYLLLCHSSLNQNLIAGLLKKKQAAISKHNSFIKNLSEISPFEKEILKKVMLLNEKIKNYKANK